MQANSRLSLEALTALCRKTHMEICILGTRNRGRRPPHGSGAYVLSWFFE